MPPVVETGNSPVAGFSSLRRFLPYLWPADDRALRMRVVIALVLVLVAKGITLSMGWLYKWAIDRMVPGMEASAQIAIALVVAYAGARFAGVLFDNLRNTIFERVGQDATRHLASNVFRRLHALSLRFHLDRRTGAVAKIIERGTKSIDTMLYFLLFNIAPTVIELIVVSIFFWVKFGFILVAATLLMVVAYIWFTRAVTDWRAKLREDMNTMDTGAAAKAVDSLLNYETVKYFNAEDRETARYAGAAKAYADAAVKSENSLAWLNVGQSLITNLMMAGAMGFVVWGWSKGRFTTGDVVLVNTWLSQLFRPLDLLGMVYRTIRQGLIDMEAMFGLIDTPAEIVDVPNALPLIVGEGVVRFENVSFAYDKDRQILHGVDFEIPAGGTLAVVGPSGAGKSTLARLLFRFYDTTGGRITIDGQDIAKVSQASLRAAIGIVPQDTVLFNDTIGYNIAYGREGSTQDQVEDAARGAAIHGFIASLPDQYSAKVGERGLKLSGGEKQRVAIARTLLKNPPILILDEATSALDSRTEAEIQTTLKAIAARRSTIVIAHRLSTIVDADEIVVLEAGRVCERGTHATLLAKNGLYAEMWMRQAAEHDLEAMAAAE
ncbi:ABC transporter ATP-binding protein/permease [Sphingomonas paeninsulae]|jgi:ABC-type transport system involved in Fe-S cluster assembly fused permease/ATPase subunit|uniref:ABC transporter ATP-binding protein/permease n=1 Tax=Sphingomonas paeninsulae TaxID=2319844 RepID=A0A494TL08_SPHPE|nr:ABC transporter ATP-binding protein/permease [Sphingomonas paeninsulae]AYJ86506.1 ABC transporter ATP-binding protein/permease [Sphingomonas paeninsulae]